MPLGTGARTQLRYMPEVTFGVTPTTGNCLELRRTDDSLDFQVQTTMSNEVRSDRQTSDLTIVGASAEGGVDIEMSFKEYDPFLEAALQGTWAHYGTAGAGSSFSATYSLGNTLTAGAAPTGANAFTTLARGQWVRISSAGANGGKIVQISKTVSPTATVIVFEGSGLTNGVEATTSLQTSRLTNGVIQRSFSLERAHEDIGKFILWRGMTVSQMSLNLESGSLVTGKIDFIGKDQVVNNARVLPGTPVVSQTGQIMNAVTGVGTLMEGGAPLSSTFIKSLSFQLNNKLRGRDAVGHLGNVDIGSGSIELTGNMSVYFADTVLYEKFLASQRTSLSFLISDNMGAGYVFTLPSMQYSEASIKAGGKEADSMVDFTYTALMDPILRKTVLIDRVGV